MGRNVIGKLFFKTAFLSVCFYPIAMRGGPMECPYVAGHERKTSIEQGYAKIKIGMTPKQVEECVGNPDEVNPLYEPKIKNPKQIGITYWYWIERRQETGNANERGEKLVRVSFDLKNQVTAVDHWGF
ncbi:MAG: hypothetical protein IPK56_05140 [Elusimicrobia bacterium]|nr:hypothetical protein [Elusimicrobiota bacterium]MBK9056696.1 hypothetical protein [Elusimicrobiota bacterium]